MIDSLIEQIRNYLAQNQFASGGIFLFALTSIGGFIYKIAPKIVILLKRKFIITIDMQGNDDVFQWFMMWLASQRYAKKTRKLSVSSKNNSFSPNKDITDSNNNDDDKVYPLYYSPGPGNHFFTYKRRLVWLNRDRQQSNKEGMFYFHEQFTITMLGRNINIAKEMIEKASKFCQKKDNNKIIVYNNKYDYWSRGFAQNKRDINSVILKNNLQYEIVKDIDTFFHSKKWYYDRGIPYKRGYLLYGEAGTGKTSIVKAVASKFNLNIYFLNLTSVHDRDLSELMFNVKLGSIVIIEDIDTVFDKRDKKEKETRITLSGLLNVIDGIIAPEGIIFFMTTNYISKLDSALIRPGRIDNKYYFGKTDYNQNRKLFNLFYPNCNGQTKKFIKFIPENKVTPAEIQQHFLKYRNVDQCINNLSELIYG